MSGRPRVLILTCHLPYPPVSGGRRRELELFRRLAKQADLDLCAISKTPDEDRTNASELDEIFRRVDIFPAAGGSARGCPVARHRSPAATEHIGRAAASGRYDLVHVEGFYLLQHALQVKIPVVLGDQNVEFALWRQRAAVASTELERRRLERQAVAIRREELEAWRAADACVAVTEDDARTIEALRPGKIVAVVPDGVDHLPAPTAEQTSATEREAVFVGNFAYEPNEDAARWLLGEIQPRLAAEVPGLTITLVGNGMSKELDELARSTEGVKVTGVVPDVAPFLRRAAVVVCPLRIGGGIKVKMLEALRLGKAIVSTSMGAQGLANGAGTAFLVEDEPARFADEVARLVREPERRKRLERSAAQFAATLPTWDEAAEALLSCYDSCLAAGGRALTGAN